MAITRRRIIEAVHEGASVANARYESWSNGSWVTDSGVEGLMVTYIAEAVSECQAKHESLDLEVSFETIKEMSRGRTKRGPRLANLGGRN